MHKNIQKCYVTKLRDDCSVKWYQSHLQGTEAEDFIGGGQYAFAAIVIHNHHLRDFQAVLE